MEKKQKHHPQQRETNNSKERENEERKIDNLCKSILDWLNDGYLEEPFTQNDVIDILQEPSTVATIFKENSIETVHIKESRTYIMYVETALQELCAHGKIIKQETNEPIDAADVKYVRAGQDQWDELEFPEGDDGSEGDGKSSPALQEHLSLTAPRE